MTTKSKIFDNIAFWVLTVLVFTVPLFFLSPAILSIGIAKLSLLSFGVMVAFVCFVIERVRQGSVSLPAKPWYLLALLIPLLYLVSSLLGVNWYKSLIGGLFEQDTFHTITICFLLMFLLVSLVDSVRKVLVILLALCSSILLSGLFQILVLILGQGLALGALSTPAISLVGSWNDLTALQVLLLGLALIALETMKVPKRLSIGLYALLVLPFFFIILSVGNFNFDLWFLRFDLPVLVGVMSLLMFAYTFSVSRLKRDAPKEDDRAERVVSKASLIVLVLSVLVVIFGGMIHTPLASKTGVNYISGQPNWQPTIGVASEVLKQSPLFGSGPNSFAYEWNIYKPVEFNQLVFWNTNFAFGVGVVPTSLVTLGVLGLIAWLLFYGFVIHKSFSLLFRSDKSLPVSLRASISFLVLFSTFLMFFYTPGLVIQIVHFVVIGLLLSLNSLKGRKLIPLNGKQWHQFVAVIIAIVSIILVLFWGYVVAEKTFASYYVNKAVVSSTNEEEALSYLRKTLVLDPTQPIYGQLVARVFVSKVLTLSTLSPSEIVSRKDELQGYIDSAVAASVTAESMDRTDFSSVVMTGRLLEYFGGLGVAGAYDQAILKYESASLLSPTNPLPHIFASNSALLKGDREKAKEFMIKAITLKNNYADSPVLAEGITAIINEINKDNTDTDLQIEDESSTDSDEVTEE